MASEGRERLHWHNANLDWDGEDFTMVIPNAFEEWPATWLSINLTDRLRSPRLSARVSGATFHRGGGSTGIDRWGSVEILMRDPLPDPAELQERVNAAVDEAHEVAAAAVETGTNYLADLKAVTDS